MTAVAWTTIGMAAGLMLSVFLWLPDFGSMMPMPPLSAIETPLAQPSPGAESCCPASPPVKARPSWRLPGAPNASRRGSRERWRCREPPAAAEPRVVRPPKELDA